MDQLIFTKTEAGLKELQTRSGLIGQKERQLLFMIDGQRSSAMLVAMLPGQEVLLTLKKLQDLGLIARNSAQKKLDQIQFSGPTTIAPPPPRRNSEQLNEARKVILSVTQEFLGQNWEEKLGIMLQSVRNADDLKPIVEEWANALRRSGHRGAAYNGEKAIEELFK
ncbi:hypothetical protein HQ393_11880 [Chitinibacter bivalviorum]|uniref:Uncharacterized protein n=1 Tax=Chitinibacter bivalviorum TaxID=2739434 RepID=A0A7H9BKM7_9NEIS|nr:hypothetical protein [Chitinibacter bivalviorum]QLG88876.1 hypothetical protein HQ393_11880 [Chitinibacter bivalviorum]